MREENNQTINTLLIEAMRDMKVSRAELARRLKVSRANVTQMLRSNMTISKVVEVAEAIGCRLEVQIKSVEKL